MMKTYGMSMAMLFVCVLIMSCGNDPQVNQSANQTSATEEARKKTEDELRTANDQFYAALNALFTGDLEPMNNLWAHHGSITQMGPFGGRPTGWETVGNEFAKTAEMKLGGKVVCEDLHIYAGIDMGYTLCIEKGENMSADGIPITVRHRATNIFHRIDGQWKLVHHHTDLSPQLTQAVTEKE